MFRGAIAPCITFFNTKGEIDEQLCRWHMEWMLSKGVKGLFVSGTYGSGYMLSSDEKAIIFEAAKQVSNNYLDTYVIAHISGPDLASNVSLAKLASEMEMDAISAINPLYYSYSDNEVLRYYESLINASEVPFFAYNNPELTGKVLSPSFVSKVKELGAAGIKDSSVSIRLAASLYAEQKLKNDSFQYIPGTTTGWLGFQKMGALALIAGMCNYVPELVAALYNTSFEDDIRAAEIYQITMTLADKLKFGNSIQTSHICLRARGYDSGHTRSPMTALCMDIKELAEIDKVIEEATNKVKLINKSDF